MTQQLNFAIEAQNDASRDVNAVAGDLAELGAEAKEAGAGLADTEQESSRLEGSLKTLGAVAGGIVLADMVTGAPEALGGFLDMVDESVVTAGKLEAQLGLTKEEAKDLGDVAKSVYRDNFGESLDQVTGQVAAVTRSLGLQGDELKNTVEDINRVTDAFGDQGAESQILIEGLRTMKSAFPGITEQQSLDLITRGFQNGLGASGDFLDTLQEYPANFAAIGLSADDMMAFLDVGMKAGARNTDLLADAVKEFGIRVKTAGDTGEKALAAMFPPAEAERLKRAFAEGGQAGHDAFFQVMQQLAATTDQQERYTLAVELFGTKGEDLVGVLDRMGPGLAEIAKGTESAEGATKGLDAQYAGTASTLETLRRQTMGYVTDALQPISPIIGTIVPGMVDMAGGALEIGSSAALMAGQAGPAFATLATASTSAGAAIKVIALNARAAAPELALLTAAAVILTAGYLSQKNDAAQLAAATAGLTDKHAALAEVEARLQTVQGNSAKGVERLRAELEKQIASEDAATLSAQKNAIQTDINTIATEQAARATGSFDQMVKDLNESLDAQAKVAGDAFGALDKFKAVPTQEQLELRASIASVNAELAVAQQQLNAAKAAGDENTATIEAQIKSLETERQRYEDANSVIDANREKTVAMGDAKLGASGKVAGLVQSEGELLQAASDAAGALSGQESRADTLARAMFEASVASETLYANLVILSGAPPPPGPLSAPMYAEGTDYAAGGWSWVGEQGPELRWLNRGDRILSNQKSMELVGAAHAQPNAPEPAPAAAASGSFGNVYGDVQIVLPNASAGDFMRQLRWAVPAW